jgi:K+-transporting ATPase KdpF subunit
MERIDVRQAPARAPAHRRVTETTMELLYLILALALGAYLVYALLNAEDF